MNRITSAIAALTLGACLTACTTTKPAEDATRTDDLNATNSDQGPQTTGKTIAGEENSPDGLVDAQTGKTVEGLGELLVTNGALDADSFYLSPMPTDHTVFLNRGDGTRRYVFLDGSYRHVANLIETINMPEAPFPPAEPKTMNVELKDGGVFQVVDSEQTRDQPRDSRMLTMSFSSRYYTYEVQILEGVDASWLYNSFSFSPPDELRCEAASECPVHNCDCGGGNTMSTDHYPCELGLCTVASDDTCPALCDTADFGEAEIAP